MAVYVTYFVELRAGPVGIAAKLALTAFGQIHSSVKIVFE
jgi:hypothetical protein